MSSRLKHQLKRKQTTGTALSKRITSLKLKHNHVPFQGTRTKPICLLEHLLDDVGGSASVISGMRISNAEYVIQAHYFSLTYVSVKYGNQ